MEFIRFCIEDIGECPMLPDYDASFFHELNYEKFFQMLKENPPKVYQQIVVSDKYSYKNLSELLSWLITAASKLKLPAPEYPFNDNLQTMIYEKIPLHFPQIRNLYLLIPNFYICLKRESPIAFWNCTEDFSSLDKFDDDKIVSDALRYGNLELCDLLYTFKLNYYYILIDAIRNGSEEMFNWVHNHYTFTSKDYFEGLEYAIQNNDLDSIERIHGKDKTLKYKILYSRYPKEETLLLLLQLDILKIDISEILFFLENKYSRLYKYLNLKKYLEEFENKYKLFLDDEYTIFSRMTNYIISSGNIELINELLQIVSTKSLYRLRIPILRCSFQQGVNVILNHMNTTIERYYFIDKKSSFIKELFSTGDADFFLFYYKDYHNKPFELPDTICNIMLSEFLPKLFQRGLDRKNIIVTMKCFQYIISYGKYENLEYILKDLKFIPSTEVTLHYRKNDVLRITKLLHDYNVNYSEILKLNLS